METAILITLPLSHFCEKSRWALDYTGMPYKEAGYAPAFHRSATRKYGGTTVPLLVHNHQAINDSAEIAIYVDALVGNNKLYRLEPEKRAEIIALEKKFDTDLGTSVRRWVYAFLLDEPKLLRQIWSARVPFWQALVVPFILPKARNLVAKLYRIDQNAAEESIAQVNAVFAEVEALLADGREYLAGDQFSAADIAFAALAAPILLPAECRAAMPALAELPVAMRSVIEAMRDSTAGKFALKIYATERG